MKLIIRSSDTMNFSECARAAQWAINYCTFSGGYALIQFGEVLYVVKKNKKSYTVWRNDES